MTLNNSQSQKPESSGEMTEDSYQKWKAALPPLSKKRKQELAKRAEELEAMSYTPTDEECARAILENRKYREAMAKEFERLGMLEGPHIDRARATVKANTERNRALAAQQQKT